MTMSQLSNELGLTRSKILVILAIIAAACAVANAQEKKPNILVIVGDDIGQTNVSAYLGD
jgi:arylsulfatase